MKLLITCLAILALPFSVCAQNWDETVAQAQGQTVYFHAWGGSQEVNSYIGWAARELKQQYNVELRQVKVTDIAETTSRLLAEKVAGQHRDGSIDLVWINGENFKSMKDNHLLYGPFTETLPNWHYVNKSLPVSTDFSEPTEGMEAPWGVGQLVFIYDKKRLYNPPESFAELLSYAHAFPNRITYPRPPEFHGTSFLKALLVELTDNDPALSKPVDSDSFGLITASLWKYLDELHPYAWRAGRQFPASSAQMIQLLDDNQIDLAVTFNPNEVYAAQAGGKLSESARVYAFAQGALSNIHFLAIPWNAHAKAGALVTINFLLSPRAQSRKGDITVWGDPSVLRPEYLTGSAARTHLFKSIPELHPSWQSALEEEWQKRYGS